MREPGKPRPFGLRIVRDVLIRAMAVVWLVTITPLFALLPLWCILNRRDRSGPICHLEMAVLDDVWATLYPTRRVNNDEWPPLTEKQWWLMIFIVLSVAALALYYCFLWWRQAKTRAASRSGVEI